MKRLKILAAISLVLTGFIILSLVRRLHVRRPLNGDEALSLTILASYNKKLKALPRHTYKDAKIYKQLGPPLSTVLDKSVNQTVKIILVWTKFWGAKDWIPKTICKGSKTCIGTTNKADLSKSDGIVVHPIDLKGEDPIPRHLLPRQRLIYLVQEPPWLIKINVSHYNGVFNWTATYRRDSETPFTFVWAEKKESVLSDMDYQQKMKEIMSTKTRLVAVMNSDCFTKETNRLQYIDDLKKWINVDFYGKCGNLECPRNEKCDAIMSQYKFYLAFENAHCRDYITEKVHNPFHKWNSVPVVMGAADPGDYERILPPNSYIHTSGFNSVRELAEYLTLLDRNPLLYEKYHQWRKTHKLSSLHAWCDLCEKLHNTSLPVQVYSDFAGWYLEDTCLPYPKV